MIRLLPLLLLVGCVPASTLNVAKAEFLCKDHGGLYDFIGFKQRPVYCVDGTRFDVNAVREAVIDDPEYYPKGK
tara:strand:+ start:306 stop:527 length:222 start_codon:yes stop_codon:yes gene_type:complete